MNHLTSTLAFTSLSPLPLHRPHLPLRSPRHSPHRVAPQCATPPPVNDIRTILINRSTGDPARRHTANTVELSRGQISLPTDENLPISYLTPPTPSSRSATAAVYAYPSALGRTEWTAGARVVVFAHGFSQRPDNYASTLLRLAEEGYVIVAPRVWFASVIAPWARVETQGVFAPLPRKLQTALLIDVARCVQIATDGGAKAVHLLGHSMGAAMMLAYARFPPRGVLESVALLAPAVKDSSVSELNPYVTIGEGGDVSGIEKLAKEIEDVRIIALQGKRDGIVDADDTGLVMAALKNREALTGLLYLEDGTHVGFEDQLDVRLNLPFLVLLERFVFRILDFLIYVVNVFDIDAEEQQVLTKLVLERWLVFDHMNDGKTIVDSVMDRNKDASTDLLKRVSNAIQQFTW